MVGQKHASDSAKMGTSVLGFFDPSNMQDRVSEYGRQNLYKQCNWKVTHAASTYGKGMVA